jgi:glycine dehydrogenase subunit 1
MPYTPHTPQEIKDMLIDIGIKNEEELFDKIPNELRTKGLDIPDGIDEFSTYNIFKKLSLKNSDKREIYMGGGYYDHIVPSAVDALSGRSEFYTAYTPYQAEASQGTLGVLYEYQSLMCNLTGMDVSNATMYDGATALAEAALMAIRITKKDKIVIDSGVNPNYIKIVTTYLKFRDIKVVVIPVVSDLYNLDEIKKEITKDCAGFLFQNPNFFGTCQDFSNISKLLKENGSLSIASAYPISLGILKTPSQMGADIVSGDGQSLGNYLNFGGPSFGILATKDKYIRNLPGRIIGKTIDKNSNDIFVLTMQAREQHIRRDKATSNICSNQNLLALRATIFLSLIGESGLVELASTNHKNSQYLKNNLMKIDGIKIFNSGETFNEFVIEINSGANEFLLKLREKGFYGGINLMELYGDKFSKMILVTVTEKKDKNSMDRFIQAIKDTV